MNSKGGIRTATAQGGSPRGLLNKASAHKTATAQYSEAPKPYMVSGSSETTIDASPRTLPTTSLPASSGNPGTAFDFDGNSGISEDEQQEILAQINDIAEKNRLALSAGTQADGGTPGKGFKAKKHGGFFPVLVNIFAITVLVGGFFALYFFQSEADVHAREGIRAMNPAERAIIYEIRRETNNLLAAADNEINILVSLLADIEMQLQALVAGGEALTPEQLATQTMLMAQREELRTALDLARGERVRILNYARSQEIVVHAQFETRVREEIFQDGPGIGVGEYLLQDEFEASAREELVRLTGEQTQAAAVEAQVAGLLTHVYRQIAERSFDEAEGTLGSLQVFLNDPAFQNLRAIQARRDLYIQATATIKALLEEYRATYDAMLSGVDRAAEMRHQEEIAQLQRELDEAREALVAEDPDMLLAIAELESSLALLQSANATLTSQNTTLTSQNTTLSSQNTALVSQNTTLSSQVNTLQGNLTAQTQTAESLRQNIIVLQTENTSLNETAAARYETINELQSENNNLRNALYITRQTIEHILRQGL